MLCPQQQVQTQGERSPEGSRPRLGPRTRETQPLGPCSQAPHHWEPRPVFQLSDLHKGQRTPAACFDYGETVWTRSVNCEGLK